MTISDILYNLFFAPPPFNEQGEKSWVLIARVISNLPEDIQEKVLDELGFICLDGVHGQYDMLTLPKGIKKGDVNCSKPIVYLNFDSMKRKSEIRKMSIVAHEIAHFILKHHKTNGGEKDERAADDLCESWGFKRGYKNYKTLESY